MEREVDRPDPEPSRSIAQDRLDLVRRLREAVARDQYAVEPIEVADAILRFHGRPVPS